MDRQAIEQARRLGRKIGLCGQAPSDYPEFASFLVDCGIHSMSLNPDAVLPTTRLVLEMETKRAGDVREIPHVRLSGGENECSLRCCQSFSVTRMTSTSRFRERLVLYA